MVVLLWHIPPKRKYWQHCKLRKASNNISQIFYVIPFSFHLIEQIIHSWHSERCRGKGGSEGSRKILTDFADGFRWFLARGWGSRLDVYGRSHVQQAILFLFMICKDLLQFFSFCLDSYLWCSSMIKTHDAWKAFLKVGLGQFYYPYETCKCCVI